MFAPHSMPALLREEVAWVNSISSCVLIGRADRSNNFLIAPGNDSLPDRQVLEMAACGKNCRAMDKHPIERGRGTRDRVDVVSEPELLQCSCHILCPREIREQADQMIMADVLHFLPQIGTGLGLARRAELRIVDDAAFGVKNPPIAVKLLQAEGIVFPRADAVVRGGAGRCVEA